MIRWQVPARGRLAGERDVDASSWSGARSSSARSRRRLPLGERRLELLADGVQRHARSRGRAPRGAPSFSSLLRPRKRTRTSSSSATSVAARDRRDSLGLERLRVHRGDCTSSSGLLRVFRSEGRAVASDRRRVRHRSAKPPTTAIGTGARTTPWSRSVVEDVAVLRRRGAEGGRAVHAGRRSRRAGGRARRRHGADRRSRSRGPAFRVIGVDSSAGMLEVCRDAGRGGGRRRAPRPAPRRPARARPSTSASRSSPVPSARTCTCDDRRRAPALRSRAAHGLLLPGGHARLRRLRARARRHRRDPRPLDRARAGDLGARRLGRGASAASRSSVRGRRASRDDDARVDLRRRVARRCSSESGFEVEACYGWFDRRPYTRRRGLDLARPPAVTM